MSIVGSIKQLGCVLLGFVLGKAMHDVWLPSENLGTYCLMLLVLLVGIQLRSSGITLRQVLINKRGVQTSVLITLSGLCGGLLFCRLAAGRVVEQGLGARFGFWLVFALGHCDDRSLRAGVGQRGFAQRFGA